MKDFRLLKNEIPINILPLIDDILIICGAPEIFFGTIMLKIIVFHFQEVPQRNIGSIRVNPLVPDVH